jgi:hypothetical protein
MLVVVPWHVPSAALAQTRGDPLQGRQFNVDLVTGPIVGPNRVVSLGGAYTALGYGVDNAIITPAAYGARTLWDTRWFEFDVTVDYSPGALRRIDFINNGRFLGSSGKSAANSDFLFVTLGASMMFGELGFGGIVRTQNYRIGDYATLTLILANYGGCYAFLDGQLLVGLAARTAALTLTSVDNGAVLGTFTQTGPEAGAILGLADRPYRIGVAARSPVQAKSANNNASALPFTPPAAMVLPAELQFGFAYQFGDRPLNRRWINPFDRARELRNAIYLRRLQRQQAEVEREQAAFAAQREAAQPGATVDMSWLAEPGDQAFWRVEHERTVREEAELQAAIQRAEAEQIAELRALSRRYLLVSTDVVIVGTVSNGIGLESFLSQLRQDSGKHPALSFRIGLEGEPIPNRLRLRVGSYLEPSRFAGVNPRLHATLGGDVKLFAFDLFGLVSPFDLRLTASLDVAERYRNFGVSVGIWH